MRPPSSGTMTTRTPDAISSISAAPCPAGSAACLRREKRDRIAGITTPAPRVASDDLVGRDAACREDAGDRFRDLVVRRARAGRQPDPHRPVRGHPARRGALLVMQAGGAEAD